MTTDSTISTTTQPPNSSTSSTSAQTSTTISLVSTTIESSTVPTSLPTNSTSSSSFPEETPSVTSTVSSSSLPETHDCSLEGLIEVEDGSCVPPSFFEIEPHPDIDIGTPPFPVTTVLPFVPINGPAQATNVAIRGTTSIAHEPLVLPATGSGLEVTIPLIMGAILTPVGFWLRRISRRPS